MLEDSWDFGCFEIMFRLIYWVFFYGFFFIGVMFKFFRGIFDVLL